MKIQFSQAYIDVDASFPFSYRWQTRVSDEISALVKPSDEFIEKYGRAYDLVFNVSAKLRIKKNQILGPTVFKRTKDVEYTVFLPFSVISKEADVLRAATQFLFEGACSVMESLGIDTAAVRKSEQAIINGICSDPTMLDDEDVASYLN